MKTAKQDLLMFLGTRKEVDQVECINNCMYFAWDTGEIFLGTNHNTKTRYGGSRNSISKTDLLKILEKELESSRINASNAVGIANKNTEILEKAVNSFREEMSAFKKNITFEISQKADEIFEGLEAQIITIKDFEEKIGNYYTKKETDNTFLSKESAGKGFIQYLTGAEIAANLLTLDGVYFCTVAYQNSIYDLKGGSIYRISKGKITELAVNGSGGSGSGGGSTSVIELFTVNNSESIVNFAETAPRELNIKMITTSPSDIKSASVYFDSKNLGPLSVEANTITDTFYIPDEVEFTLGKHAVKLVCTLKSGLIITNSVDFYITRPIYYGAGLSSTPVLEDLAKAPARIDPTGDYDITTTKVLEYLWFVYPINLEDQMIVDTDLLTIKKSVAGLPHIMETHGDYQYIRSANAILPGTWTLSVTGKGGNA